MTTRLPALLGCTTLLLAPALSAQDQPKAKPVFENGEAQQVEAFSDPREWIREELFVETEFDSDGDKKPDRMHVAVTRPKQTETEGLKVPVVYETSPYFAGIGTTSKKYFWDPEHELNETPPERPEMPDVRQMVRPGINQSEERTWVPRGFAVVHSCSPGTGLSQGCPTVGGDNESLAPKAVIDWLCGRAKGYKTIDGNETIEASWCTGKVGMTGTSYNGTLPLAAATTGVEGLEAIIPIAPNTSYYHYYRSNGLVRHPGGYMGEDIDVLYDFINSGNPERRDWCNKHIRKDVLNANQDRVTGDYNDFWAGRDYLNDLGPLKAATLMAHAFNDWNVMPEHSVRIYLALKEKGVPVQAFFHQGGHGGPPPLKMRNRWFTRFLYGIENGVENDPKGWVVREGDRPNDPTAYPDYPHPDAKHVVLHPQKGGNKIAQLGVYATEGRGTEKLIDDASIRGSKLARATESENRLLYTTPILKKPLHVSGMAKVKIKLAANAKAANLSIWLVSLPWQTGRRLPIYANVITRGWADPQNSESLTSSKPLTPGKFYELEFDLQPDDQVIPAGQQIGLMIFSSDRDFTLWPEPGTELTIDLDATSLSLPIVGGMDAFRAAFAE